MSCGTKLHVWRPRFPPSFKGLCRSPWAYKSAMRSKFPMHPLWNKWRTNERTETIFVRVYSDTHIYILYMHAPLRCAHTKDKMCREQVVCCMKISIDTRMRYVCVGGRGMCACARDQRAEPAWDRVWRNKKTVCWSKVNHQNQEAWKDLRFTFFGHLKMLRGHGIPDNSSDRYLWMTSACQGFQSNSNANVAILLWDCNFFI